MLPRLDTRYTFGSTQSNVQQKCLPIFLSFAFDMVSIVPPEVEILLAISIKCFYSRPISSALLLTTSLYYFSIITLRLRL